MQVQKLRLQRGWSQQQLAELSGLSVRTIQRIENGSAASTESLKSLASVFEIDFSTLSSEPAMPDTPTPTSSPSHTPSASQQEQLALLEVRKLKGFYLHLAQYVVVIAALCAINLLTTPHRLWFYWPALGWGIGILAHAAAIFSWLPFLGVDWEKRQVEKRLGRPL
ncbi:helix-turn-helix domain-containing protein [Comamonas aquatica]|jgi:transcriptional regulator with XRE-family HTH domain|uniref:DNA-binding transcriptional repressor PuuR n=1 Tax=Comamonas aquatica TaxID=225991 RepID=A0AA35D549_9BURK|nr:helix-turn-helix domain-containing protein [Comamonas aquatica]CAB5643070.1 DNA-binding transcriptional repressor PuuR [Comamonas aquatica]CAB5663858.1 DNA-binding transcriptional repressor PuuR [Comamonas aquatica]CAC9174781.1 DNA-binding transcriptional repressor PuuR [Comamonas aquatica]CAC9680045.1 DNA-binding transcriptional repressor PuuR [Comamonas aquatica]